MKVFIPVLFGVSLLTFAFAIQCNAEPVTLDSVPMSASEFPGTQAPPFECVRPGDFYVEPTVVPEVNLEKVRFVWLPEPFQEFMFYLEDCYQDGLLDVAIPYNPPFPSTPRPRIQFSQELCGGNAPPSVQVILQHQNRCTLRGLDEKGTIVAEAIVAPGSPQRVHLASEGGIREVDVDGTEICVMEVCWNCEFITPTPLPDAGCVGAGDVYAQPAFGLPEVNLGAARFVWLPEPTPGISYNVVNCAGDERLDVEIPFAPAPETTPNARIELSPNLCGGNAPTTVEVTLRHGNTCKLIALDERGGIVDSRDVEPGSLQTITFKYEGGIRAIDVQGAEICVVEVCWICPEDTPTPTATKTATPIPTPTVTATPHPGPGCETGGDAYQEPTYGLSAIHLGATVIGAAQLPTGGIAYMDVVDCAGDPGLDVWIPWTEASAPQRARIGFWPTICSGLPLVEVQVTLQHSSSCTLYALDEGSAVLDSASAEPGYPQTLILSHPDGIYAVEFEGAEICMIEVCWICGEPTTPVPTSTPTVTATPHPGLKCITAGDVFPQPGYGLPEVDLGAVLFTAAQLPTGGLAELDVVDCAGDPGLDVYIPWTEPSAPQKAKIEFSRAICSGFPPVEAQVTLQHFFSSCTLYALDEIGSVVDAATAAAGSLQTLFLANPGGIRSIEVEGAEICVIEVCWICGEPQPTSTSTSTPIPTSTRIPTKTAVPTSTPIPSPTPRPTNTPSASPTPRPGLECITAGDVYPEPVSGLPTVELGWVRFVAAELPTGGLALLNVEDCSKDGPLDVYIPWSEASATSKARIEFSPNLCNGTAPISVDVFLQHGNACVLDAYSDAGELVDSATAVSFDPQVLTLASDAGIRYIEVEGAQICVIEVCWICGEVPTLTPTPPGGGGCAAAGDVFPTPTYGLLEVNLGNVTFTAAQQPTGGFSELDVVDCAGDPELDVHIPWSEASAPIRAKIELSTNICRGNAPQFVEVLLQHGNSCTLYAFDDNGNPVDSVNAEMIPDPQSLFLSSPSGIRTIEVEGAEICVIRVCWICEIEFDTATPTPTRPSPATPTPTDTRIPVPTDTPTVVPTETPQTTTFYAYLGPYLPVIMPPLIPYPFGDEDLFIHGIEVTQAIQHFDTSNGVTTEPDNSMPLVLEKSTAARIYLGYTNTGFGTERANVPVRFYFRRAGEPVWTAALGSTTALGEIDQSDVNHSADILFMILSESASQDIEMYAIVDPDDLIDETDETNNRFPETGYLTLTFHRREPVQVVGRRLDYHPSGYSGTRLAGGWPVNGGGAQWWNAVLPLPDGGVEYSVASGYLDWTTTLSTTNGKHALIEELNGQYVLATILSLLFTGEGLETDKIYGWCPADAWTGGHADMPMYPHAGGLGVVAIGTDVTGTSVDDPGRGAKVFGHELCHTYDVQHTNTWDGCGSSDDSTDYPYTSSSIQEFGFNPTTGKVYDPAGSHDLMGYCAVTVMEPWISPFHWNKMFNALPVSKMSFKPLKPREEPQPNVFYKTQQPASVMVSALILNPTMAAQYGGELTSIYLVETGSTLVLPQGEYAIELRNGETVLSRQDFAVSFANDWEIPEYTEPEYPDAEVSLVLPWETGTTSIVLLHADTILDQRPVSANAPTVTITNPSGAVDWPAASTQTLAWQGDDLDGDELAYSVFYSFNSGGNWHLLASELPSVTYEVAVDSLAGGTDCRFRVVVNDGVLTGFDETDAPITVPKKDPMALITNPTSGSRFAPGGMVFLQGVGTDLEDGALPPTSLVWSSDLQGELGTGPLLPVNTLDVGEHTITLMVTDSDLQSVTDTVSIGINTLEQFTVDMNADGFVDQDDLFGIMRRWKQSVSEGYPPSKADFNADGEVDARDLFELQRHWQPRP